MFHQQEVQGVIEDLDYLPLFDLTPPPPPPPPLLPLLSIKGFGVGDMGWRAG